MRADPRAADVVGAVISIVRTRRTVRLVVVQAGARAVTRVGVGAIIVGGITAGRTGR